MKHTFDKVYQELEKTIALARKLLNENKINELNIALNKAYKLRNELKGL